MKHRFGAIALLLLLALQGGLAAQPQTLTVADGTTTNMNVPLFGATAYSSYPQHTQLLYPEQMLGSMVGQYISELRFYCSQTAPSYGGTLTVGLATYEASSFAADALLDVAVDVVMVGNFVASNGSYVFQLQTPWLYNGGHLLVDIVGTGGNSAQIGLNYGVWSQGASCYHTTSFTTTTLMQNFMPKTTFTYSGSPCGRPSALTVGDISADGATLSWQPAVGATGYVVLLEGVAPITTTATEHPLEALEPNSEYTVTVAALCSSGDTMASQPVTFRTLDTATALWLPYAEDFEVVGDNGLPRWWHRVDSCTYNGAVYPDVVSNNNTHSGTSMLRLGLWICTSASVATEPLPAMANELHVGFWYKFSGYTNEVLEACLVDSGGVFHPVWQYSMSAGDNDWHHVDFYTDTMPASLGVVAFGLRWLSDEIVYIDDIEIERVPYCPRPLAIGIDSLGPTDVYLHLAPADSGDLLVVTVDGEELAPSADTLLHIWGLAPAMLHTVSVSTLCANGERSQSIDTSFQTTCADMLQLPWAESFDGHTVGEAPACWTTGSQVIPASSYSPLYPLVFNGENYYYATPHTAPNALMVGQSDQQVVWVATPAFDADPTLLRIDFWYKPNGYFGAGYFQAGFMAASGDIATFVPFYSSQHITSSGEFEWKHVELITDTLGMALPDTVRLAFRVGTSGLLAIDDIRVRSTEGCPQPLDLHATSIGTNQATIEWSASSDDYQNYAFQVTVDGENYSIENDTQCVVYLLEPNTTHTIGVQSLCADGSVGDLQELTFTTACATATLPLSEDFESAPYSQPVPDCWQVLAESGSGYSSYPRRNALNYHSASHSVEMEAVGAQPCMVASLPFYAVSAGLYIRFWEYHTGDDSTLTVGLMTDVGDTGSFTPIWTVDDNYDLPNPWRERQVYVTGLTAGAVYHVAFLVTGNGHYIIDDLEVFDMPLCQRPSCPEVVEVGYDVATLMWCGDSALYELRWSTENDPEGAEAMILTDTTVTLTGLLSDTMYYAWVRTVCSDIVQSEWLALDSFKTDCAPAAMPYSEDFLTYEVYDDPECWRYFYGVQGSVPGQTITLVEQVRNNWEMMYDSTLKDVSPTVWMPFYHMDAVMASPLIDIPDSVVLEFNVLMYFKQSFNLPDSVDDDLRFGVVVSYDNCATWIHIAEWGGSPTTNLLRQMIDLDFNPKLILYGPGTIRVGFYILTGNGSYEDLDDIYLHFDDVKVYTKEPDSTGVAPGGILQASDPVAAVYPNPASSTVTIDCSAPAEAVIYAANGMEALRVRCRAGRNEVDVRSLPQGVYHLVVGASHTKLVIAR